MRYRLHLSALDVIDNVDVRATLFDDGDHLGSDRRTVLELNAVVRGSGEDDPREWVRDALIALLETI